MFCTFDAGVLVSTSYFASAQALAGRPLCVVRGEYWHLLLPTAQVFPRRQTALAMPVRGLREPEGWQWKLWISPTWSVLLPLSCFEGAAPPLIEPGTRLDRHLLAYGHWLPGLSDHCTYPFGSVKIECVPCLYNATLQVRRAARKM